MRISGEKRLQPLPSFCVCRPVQFRPKTIERPREQRLRPANLECLLGILSLRQFDGEARLGLSEVQVEPQRVPSLLPCFLAESLVG